MKKMQSNQAGFTLIELVMVIVILGILAATALPKFVDLSGEASAAAAQGFAGALNSANSVNYAACAAKNTNCVAVTKCSEIGPLVVPAVTFVTTMPDPTVQGKIYLATDTASDADGVSCSAVYGDGTTAGKPFTFTATTTTAP